MKAENRSWGGAHRAGKRGLSIGRPPAGSLQATRMLRSQSPEEGSSSHQGGDQQRSSWPAVRGDVRLLS